MACVTAAGGDYVTNDLTVSDGTRANQLRVRFLAEHAQ